jgi:2-polyprenyl-3-methyl-5-hydroxy-6-metoxy-1,4-benzoquinol methylase
MELKKDSVLEELNSIKEELFCTKFELAALSSMSIKAEAERWVPGFFWPKEEHEHLARYEFACSLVRGKRVLDVACGCGFGSYLLATCGEALSVLGADIDKDSVRYGQAKYPAANIVRTVADATHLNFKEEFDVAVSFETIEHLENPEGFINTIHESLGADGLFLVSTPITLQTTTTPYNPFHKIEWSYEDFQNMLSKRFSIERVYVQSIEHKPAKLIALLRRIFNRDRKIKPVTTALVEIKEELKIKKILKGYQLVVCRKK